MIHGRWNGLLLLRPIADGGCRAGDNGRVGATDWVLRVPIQRSSASSDATGATSMTARAPAAGPPSA